MKTLKKWILSLRIKACRFRIDSLETIIEGNIEAIRYVDEQWRKDKIAEQRDFNSVTLAGEYAKLMELEIEREKL